MNAAMLAIVIGASLLALLCLMQPQEVLPELEFPGGRLSIAPARERVAEARGVTISLVPACTVSCGERGLASLLALAEKEVRWFVNGIVGGNAEIGRLTPQKRDAEGRVIAVLYTAPERKPHRNAVVITAIVQDGFSLRPYQYKIRMNIVAAGDA